jgi:hypothetical protein
VPRGGQRQRAANACACRMPAPRVQANPTTPHVVASVRAIVSQSPAPSLSRTYVKRAVHALLAWRHARNAVPCKSLCKRTSCLCEILKPTLALHNDGLSSLKLLTVAHTRQMGRSRLRWSINCDALRCAYLHTRLPSASQTARDTGRVIVLCTASAVGASGAGGTHWTYAKGVEAMAPPERCVVACPPVHQLAR